MTKKILISVIFIVMVISFLHDDLFQIKQTDAAGAYNSLKRLNNLVTNHDLIFINKFNDQYFETLTPISYFFDFQTFTMSNLDEIKNVLINNFNYFNQHYQTIFVMTDQPILKVTWLKWIGNIPYFQGSYERALHSPPKMYQYDRINFYLYRVNLNYFRQQAFLQTGLFILKQNSDQLLNFNSDHAWSKSCSKMINLNYVQNDSPLYLQVNLLSKCPNWQRSKDINLRVFADNHLLNLTAVNPSGYWFSFPINIKKINSLKICVKPFMLKSWA